MPVLPVCSTDPRPFYIEPEADGIIRSRVFPGLWLDKSALLEGDLAKVLQVLGQGLSSPEHKTFVGSFAANLGE